MRALFIGLGSIAKKHIKALRTLYPEAEVWALRSGQVTEEQGGIRHLYDWKDIPADLNFTAICNPTSLHLKTVNQCLDAAPATPIFLEKPPLMTLEDSVELMEKLQALNARVYTAFNMRFHPAIQWLKENMDPREVLEVQTYCGSYLPDWRPGQDYRQVYSARKELGGGVHLDLIHELDYLLWLFGKPKACQSFMKKVSNLEINVNDIAHYWLEYDHLNISVILNYYRRDPKRVLEIVMKQGTWWVDLINGKVENSQGDVLFSSDSDISETYLQQMKYFIDRLNDGKPLMNDLSESLQTLSYSLN